MCKKYLVTERFVEENETWDVPRVIFDNKEDAEFYVDNSDLSLMINTVKLLDNIRDLKIVKYLDIKFRQSITPKLEYKFVITNNFDISDIDKLNSINIFGDTVHIRKVIPEGFVLTNDEGKMISICRKIFGYVKEKELYDTYEADSITITDENFRDELLDLFV